MGSKFIEKFLTFIFDVLTINVAFAATFWLRYKSRIFPDSYDPHLNFYDYFGPMLILCVGWIIIFVLTGLYRSWYKESRIDEFLAVLKATLAGAFLIFMLLMGDELIGFAAHMIKQPKSATEEVSSRVTEADTDKQPQGYAESPADLHEGAGGTELEEEDDAARLEFPHIELLGTYWIVMLIFATFNRFAMHTFFAWLFSKGIGLANVLIIGANESGEKLARDMRRFPQLGYRVAGFIDDDGRKKGSKASDYPVLGTYSDIPAIVKRERVSGLIIAHVSASPNEILRIINYSGDLNVTIYMIPSLMDVITGHLKTHQIFGVPLMVLLQDHMPGWEARLKRLMDIVVSTFVLVLGAPMWLATALAIKMTSPGPAVYKQERIGQNGKPFVMMKFRSMYEDAERRSGPQWATENDPRITPMGRFIRKTRLDEIPQFINVLKGEMSLVGPRPERAFFIEKLKKEIPWYVRRIKMKPGITGWAQVKHKYDETIEDVKQKVMYDLYYFENMSIALDMKIMLRTIMVVFTGKGAH